MNWTLHSAALPVGSGTTLLVDGVWEKSATTAVPARLATLTCLIGDRHEPRLTMPRGVGLHSKRRTPARHEGDVYQMGAIHCNTDDYTMAFNSRVLPACFFFVAGDTQGLEIAC